MKWLFSLLFVIYSHGVYGQNICAPVKMELYPTYENIGIRLLFEGDLNRNSSATIVYRNTKEHIWRVGLAMETIELRTQKTEEEPKEYFIKAGSIVYLEEDSEYEVKVEVTDPDGVKAQLPSAIYRTFNSKVNTGSGKQIFFDSNATGNGNGSRVAPYRKFSDACKECTPGDIIVVRKGIHYMHSQNVKILGNQKNWVKILGEPGAVWTDAHPKTSGIQQLQWMEHDKDVEGRIIYKTTQKRVHFVSIRKQSGIATSSTPLWSFHRRNNRGANAAKGHRYEHLKENTTKMNQFGAYYQEKDQLYLILPDGLKMSEADIQLTINGPSVINFQGHHVLIEGLTFENTLTLRVTPIKNYRVYQYIFRDNTFFGMMDRGLRAGEESLVENNRFYHNSYWDWYHSEIVEIKEKKDQVKYTGLLKTKNNQYVEPVGVHCEKQGVIRYNHFHQMALPIPLNFINYQRDSGEIDVYGNLFEKTGDAAIVTDGPAINVRVYQNVIKDSFNGISVAPAHKGPVYIYRNIIDNYRNEAFFIKNGTRGWKYLFHNTCSPITQDSPINGTEICSYSIDRHGLHHTQFINNILFGKSQVYQVFKDKKRYPHFQKNEFNNNMLWPFHDVKDFPIKELNPIISHSNFVNAIDFNYLLKENSALDKGKIIMGLNDQVILRHQFNGKAPDLGAIEEGRPMFYFGVKR